MRAYFLNSEEVRKVCAIFDRLRMEQPYTPKSDLWHQALEEFRGTKNEPSQRFPDEAN